MTPQKASKILETKFGSDSGLAALVIFDFGADGATFVDARTPPDRHGAGANLAALGFEAAEINCRLALSLADFAALIKGDVEPITAFMTGRLKIDGNMGVAMRLQGML